MSAADDGPPTRRERPDGSAWRAAQRDVAGKNEETQRRGRAERAQREKEQAAHQRVADRQGDVQR
jgi:hypothetical protein